MALNKKAIEAFQHFTLVQLKEITGIDDTRWCRYLSGKVGMTSRTLEKASQELGMEPGDLLEAIKLRSSGKREENLTVNASSSGREKTCR